MDPDRIEEKSQTIDPRLRQLESRVQKKNLTSQNHFAHPSSTVFKFKSASCTSRALRIGQVSDHQSSNHHVYIEDTYWILNLFLISLR